MNMSPSSILAGMLFGIIGMWLLRAGKRKSDPRLAVIGVVMMIYGFFSPNPYFDWGVGFALCYAAYAIWN